jgi:outer membrane protein W
LKKAFVFILVLSYSLIQAQIINTESLRMVTDTTGWAGKVGLDVSLSKNTRSKFKVKNKIHLQYKTKKHLFIFVNKIGFEQVDDEDFVNKGVQHLRHNYKINKKLSSEVFLQNQYNALYKIDFRELAGAGLRYKLTTSEKYKMYLGSVIMYEYEKTAGDIISYNKDIRNSSYLSFSFYFTKNLSMVSTTYYQPKLSNFSDFRIAHQSALKFKIAKNLSYKLSFNYSYDKFPVIGIPNEEYDISNGLVYKLK